MDLAYISIEVVVRGGEVDESVEENTGLWYCAANQGDIGKVWIRLRDDGLTQLPKHLVRMEDNPRQNVSHNEPGQERVLRDDPEDPVDNPNLVTQNLVPDEGL